MHKLLSLWVILFLCSCTSDFSESEIKSAPNFIIIYADDMGYSDFGPLSDGKIKTPNLDILAKGGQTWTNFYSASSVCSPSRAAILTGELPISTGLYGDQIGVFFPSSNSGIPDQIETLPEALKGADYATGLFGKWHLGDKPEYYPTNHGFDEWIGIPYSNDMNWQVDQITSSNVFIPLTQAGQKWASVSDTLRKRALNPKSSEWNVPLIRSKNLSESEITHKIIERPLKQNMSTQYFTKYSVDFINKSVAEQKNFFLFIAHSMPHVPLFRSENFANKSTKGIYGDVIEEIDWSVGQILKTIQSLGIIETTYIIFTSDNGPWLTYGSHAGSSYPLKHGKGTSFEGGMRVPTIISGPDIYNGVISELGVQTDLFNTILGLAKLEPRLHLKNSFNLASVMRQKNKSPRDFVPFFVGSELRAFRLNDHKIHFVTQGAFGNPPARKVHSPPLVFNLSENIGEDFSKKIEDPEIINRLSNAAQNFERSIIKTKSIFDNQYK